MKDFSVGAAIDVFEVAIKETESKKKYDKKYLQKAIKHSLLVAACAEIISSKVPNTSPETAYALGLLHDYGKLISKDSDKSFHGLTGYWAMKKKGWDLAANVCLTHTFPETGFLESDYKAYGKTNIKNAKEELQKIEYNDYSRIIQLADLIESASIKQRMLIIIKNKRVNSKVIKRKYKSAMQLKSRLDKECGCNIYDLLGIRQ